MSQNVAQAIEKQAAGLIDQLNTNVAVANVVMALLGRLVIMAAQRGKPIEGISVSSPIWSERSVRAQIEFNSLSITPLGLWQGQNDLLKYAEGRAQHLAKVFVKNPGMIKFFTEFVTMLARFADSKGIQWVELKLEKAFITPNNVIVVNVEKNQTGRWS